MRALLILIGGLTMVSQIDAGCFSKSSCDVKINDNCYVYIEDAVDWAQAESCCVEWGGHLASIHSDAVNYHLNAIRNQARFTWIGLNDRAKEGTFVWTDGTNYNHNNFDVGQPDNSYFGGLIVENCVHFWDGRLTWNDLPCYLTSLGASMLSYFCQKSIYDQSITSIRAETSGPNSVLVSWSLLQNQTLSSNETFSVYYSTGGIEILAGTTNSLMYNITGLVPNVEYPIRIEVLSQMQNSSIQTFHLLKNISSPIIIPCSCPILSVPTDSSTTFSSLPPITPIPSSLSLIFPTPSSLPPISSTPYSLPPISSTPHSLPPISPTPSSLPPISPTPSSLPPISSTPYSLPPISLTPSSLSPISPTPSSLPPISPTPSSLPPISLTPSSLSPISPTPSSLPPISSTPYSLPPISPTPSSLPPISLTPSSLSPISPTPSLSPIFPTPSSLPPISPTPSSLPPASSTPSPMLPSSITSTPINPMNETIPTPTIVPVAILSTNFQFTHQLAITVGVVLIILFFVLLTLIISIILCYYMKSVKRSNKANQEKTLEYLHANQANSDFSTYATIEMKDKFESDSCLFNPMYKELSIAQKENLAKTQVSS